MLFPVPVLIVLLAAGILTAGVIALVVRGRGGRFRVLPGWVGFWVFFGGLLVCLSRAPLWLSLLLLAALMLVSLKSYFSIAPVRPGDRYSILVAYLSVPCALYTTYVGSIRLFLMMILVMALTLPLLLSIGKEKNGLLDSMGRIFIGAFYFVFCTAHLGLLAHYQSGRLELFGIMVLAAELPQRLGGRFRSNSGRIGPLIGMLAGLGLSTAAGYLLASHADMSSTQAAAGGLLIALAVAAGASISDAVSTDLEMRAAASLVGGGAFLDRAVPALYAVPVFYYFLDYLA